MKAKLKDMFSLEMNQRLEDYSPNDRENFGISVRLMVGSEGNGGSESFDILVCTPDWIKQQYQEERCVWGRHMLVVLEYDFTLIKAEVERRVSQCTGKDWLSVAEKLREVGAWEFENYRPYGKTT